MDKKEAIELFYRLHKLMVLSKRFMRIEIARVHMERLGIRHNEFELLSHLYNLLPEHPEGGTVKQLSASLPVNQPAISMILNGLVEKGHVVRRENPADRRSILLTLSPAAHAEMEAMAVAQGESIDSILSTMPQAKRKAMLDFVESMDAYFRQKS